METPFTTAIHIVQTIVSLPIAWLCIKILTQHKIWVRMKDRVNTLWASHCEKTGDRFISLDGNGH